MKTLLIGFLVFCTWSVFSLYIYVCKIKGLCAAPQNTETVALIADISNNEDTLQTISPPVMAKLPENLIVYFAFDKSEFNANLKTEKYFGASNDYLKFNPKAILSITGHTDNVGTNQYNQALGYKRAQSLQHYFKQLGIPINKIEIDSKGEREPTDNNTTVKGRTNNRRTEISIKR